MKLWKKCLTVVAALAACMAQGRPPEVAETANVTLASRSIRLGVAEGMSAFSIVFGTSGGGARAFGNGELRPSQTHPGAYEAAYAVYDNSTATPRRVEAGIIYVTVTASDDDGDGVPDVADMDTAVALMLEGTAVPNAASAGTRVSQATFTLQLNRNANSDEGGFTTDLVPDGDLVGDYEVLHAEGTMDYRRTDTGALLDFSLSNSVTNATGVARLVDSNTVRLAAFRLRVSPLRSVRVGSALLARSGDIYRGDVTFSDGLPETGVADFRSWIIQIEDPNDSNSNDVPDFSDVLAPYIVAHPRRQIVAPGDTVTLSVVVSGVGPFTFAWEQNGHELANPAADPSARVLVLPNSTDADRGSYRVRVSNAAGTVMSDSTSVSFTVTGPR